MAGPLLPSLQFPESLTIHPLLFCTAVPWLHACDCRRKSCDLQTEPPYHYGLQLQSGHVLSTVHSTWHPLGGGLVWCEQQEKIIFMNKAQIYLIVNSIQNICGVKMSWWGFHQETNVQQGLWGRGAVMTTKLISTEVALGCACANP